MLHADDIDWRGDPAPPIEQLELEHPTPLQVAFLLDEVRAECAWLRYLWHQEATKHRATQQSAKHTITRLREQLQYRDDENRRLRAAIFRP